MASSSGSRRRFSDFCVISRKMRTQLNANSELFNWFVSGRRAGQGYSARASCKCHMSVLKGAKMFEGLLQPMHLLVIFGIALLVFGPKKLPELGKGIGEGIRGFKSAIRAEEEKPISATTIVTDDHGLTKG